jgi:hypothetical protein
MWKQIFGLHKRKLFALGLIGLLVQAYAFDEFQVSQPVQVGASISTSAGMVHLNGGTEIPLVQKPSAQEPDLARIPKTEIEVEAFHCNIPGVHSVLRREEFFDVANYPTIIVTNVEISKSTHQVKGNLEIKGIVKQVEGDWQVAESREGVAQIRISFPISITDFDLADQVRVLLIHFHIDEKAEVTVSLANPFE